MATVELTSADGIYGRCIKLNNKGNVIISAAPDDVREILEITGYDGGVAELHVLRNNGESAKIHLDFIKSLEYIGAADEKEVYLDGIDTDSIYIRRDVGTYPIRDGRIAMSVQYVDGVWYIIAADTITSARVSYLIDGKLMSSNTENKELVKSMTERVKVNLEELRHIAEDRMQLMDNQ